MGMQVSPTPRRSRALAYVPCSHCGCEVTHNVHDVSRLVQCVECGLIFVNPRPEFADLAAQYEQSYFHCAQPTFGGYEDYEADREDVLRTFRRRLVSMRPLVPGAEPRLLDVGCATGIFLEAAAEAGWKAEGIDISAYAVSVASAKGFPVLQGELAAAHLPDASFDVISLWDIIEHVPDPAAFLEECQRILKPGGLLAISTPDAGSPPAGLLKGRWLGFRSIDEHLYFFSRRTMTAMLGHAGFGVNRITSVGKDISLARIIERLRYYTRIGAWLLRSVDRVMPRHSIYINPLDTMFVLAVKGRRTAP